MSRISPEIAVTDIEKSLAFYGAFGFEKDNTGIIDDKGSQWYSMALGDGALQLIRADIVEGAWPGGARGSGVNIYIAVDDVDAIYDHVKASEYRSNITSEIETAWYGLRQFSMTDPDGYLLTISTPVDVENEGDT